MRGLLIGVSMAAVLMAPRTAQGQVAPPEKGFFMPVVGATTGSSSGVVFAATFGVKVTPKLQITGELGNMANILPPSVGDQVDEAASQVANTFNGKHSSTASARATYGLVGFRYATPPVSGAHTYAEFGAGVANVHSTVDAVIRGSAIKQGDISPLVKPLVPFTRNTPTTEPMVSIGAGIILGVTRTTSVEVGYRYLHLFTADPAINMSKIFAGFRLGF